MGQGSGCHICWAFLFDDQGSSLRGSRGRRVGLQRKYARLEARQKQADLAHECDRKQEIRRQCKFKKETSSSSSSTAQILGRQKTLPLGARLGTRFEKEYTLTSFELGTGMNGAVLLAKPRKRLSVASGRALRMTLDSNSSDTSGPNTTPAAIDPFAQKSFDIEDMETEDFVAVKTLKKQGLSAASVERVLREVDIYLKMDHPGIAKLLRVFDEEEYVYLIMEYCRGGALCDRLVKMGHYTENVAKDVLRQVLSVVAYCHSHPFFGKVCHRDLKHSNFIYASRSEGSTLKLVDFGLSRILSANRPAINTFAGTLHYMAPEVILQQQHDESCDMWSVGVIAYSLLCGEVPFTGESEDQITKAILSNSRENFMKQKVWSSVGESAKDLIRKLLHKSPLHRPTAEAALQHPWFAETGDQVSIALSPEILQRVRWFAHENAVRRAVAALVVYSHGLPTGEDVELLEAQFRALDKDGNGTISASELCKALVETLGIPEDQGMWIFERLDVDGDTTINHSEFLAAAVGASLLRYNETIREAFDQFDVDKDGKIELAELQSVLGQQFCGEMTKLMFEELDTNADHGVDLDEFTAMAAQCVACSTSPAENASAPTFAAAPVSILPTCRNVGDEGLRPEQARRRFWEQQRLVLAKKVLTLTTLRRSGRSVRKRTKSESELDLTPIARTSRDDETAPVELRFGIPRGISECVLSGCSEEKSDCLSRRCSEDKTHNGFSKADWIHCEKLVGDQGSCAMVSAGRY